MPLSTADLSALSRLLDEAMDLEPAELRPWLASLPDEHRHLLPRLGRMLKDSASGKPGDFLAEGPRLKDGPNDPSTARPGDRVGPYRLIREIGRGGMGTVWLADRAEGGVKRQVALKLPRLTWGAGLAERMERERDIGALLEHPNIARLYDAGVDALGRPYLALEYIQGQPLDAWCSSQGLGLRQRLRLFQQVSRAVAYAHGRLVVHRDLKPCNVLVTADGQPHLLDFGIAKLLHESGADHAQLTQEHGRPLTPHYASPEQLRGEALTVASDIYSLGVLMFETLTGKHPHEAVRNTPAALEQAVLDEDAAPASRRAADTDTARALRGDLDAILAKALQREPGRRYATADALADDIERHLNGERVLAQRDTRRYRLRKVVGRHAVALSAAASVVLAVVAGSVVVAVQWQRTAQALERERVIKAFVSDVLRISGGLNPANAAPRNASPQARVEDGAQLIETRFRHQPELQAELYALVGGVFRDMGAYRPAADYAQRRVAALGRTAADRLERARALTTLAQALIDDERSADSEARAEEALPLAEGDPALQADALVLLARAQVALGQIDRALAHLDQVDALQVGTAAAGVPQPTAARAWSIATRARMLVIQNRQDDAIGLYDEAIETAVAAEGPLSTTAISIRFAIAYVLAETLLHADRARRFHDPAAAALNQLGGAHKVRAALESARFIALRNQLVGVDTTEQILAALEQSRASLISAPYPVPESFVPQVDYWIGVTKINHGHIAGGLPLLETSAPLLLNLMESPNRKRRVATFFGRTLMVAGQHERAAGYLNDALEARRKSGLGRHPWAAVNYRDIASNFLMGGRYAEAESILDSAPEFPPVRGEGMNPIRYGRSLIWTRARLRLASGKPQEALQLLEASAPEPGEHVDELRGFRPVYGESLCALGRYAQGLKVLREQIAAQEIAMGHPHAPGLARLRAVAGACALDAGDRQAAAKFGTAARTAFAAQPGVSPYFKEVSERLDARLASRQGHKDRNRAGRGAPVSQDVAPLRRTGQTT